MMRGADVAQTAHLTLADAGEDEVDGDSRPWLGRSATDSTCCIALCVHEGKQLPPLLTHRTRRDFIENGSGVNRLRHPLFFFLL